MDRANEKIKREALRGGVFYALLAFVLLFATLIGFFINLSPKNALNRCVENTKEALFGDEDLLVFVKDAFSSGSITLEGEDEKIVHVGDLPRGASLSFQKGKKETKFSLSGEFLTMTHPKSKKGYLAQRQGAASAVSDSAFTDAGIREEYLLLLRTYLALTEEGVSSVSSLSDALSEALSAASPSLTVKNTKEGKENIYQFSPEGLMLFFSQISREGKKEEVKEAVSSLLTLTSALCDAKPDPAKEEEALAFLLGTGEKFDSFCKKMSAEDGASSLTVLTEKGYVKKVTLSMAGSDLFLNGEIRFGEDLKKDGKVSASLSFAEGEEKRFSLSFSHEISEDSKTALIRAFQWSISDPQGYVLGDVDTSSGEIAFSWGKKKGDLGLRFFTGDEKINFRGAVGDYKKGKELRFTVKRMELDHKNVLHAPMEVTFSKKGKLSSFQKGEKELFPEGEARAALCEILKSFPY